MATSMASMEVRRNERIVKTCMLSCHCLKLRHETCTFFFGGGDDFFRRDASSLQISLENGHVTKCCWHQKTSGSIACGGRKTCKLRDDMAATCASYPDARTNNKDCNFYIYIYTHHVYYLLHSIHM